MRDVSGVTLPSAALVAHVIEAAISKPLIPENFQPAFTIALKYIRFVLSVGGGKSPLRLPSAWPIGNQLIGDAAMFVGIA